MSEERTAIERLADRIDAALRRGERRFVLEGAELDWVIDVIEKRSAPENAKVERLRAALQLAELWLDAAYDSGEGRAAYDEVCTALEQARKE